MKKHVCWDASFVESVVGNGVEESGPRDSLLSRHVPVTLQPANKRGEAEPISSPMTEDEFLNAFLTSPQRSVVAGLIGEAGTGKTHLVLWVEAKIEEAKSEGRNYLPISIPRLRTSLPGVLERLIQEVPSPQRERFADLRERLRDYRESGADVADLRFELVQKLILRLRVNKFDREGIDSEFLRIIDHLIENEQLHTLLQTQAVNDWLARESGEIDSYVKNNLLLREGEDDAPGDVEFQSVPLGAWMREEPPRGLNKADELRLLRPLRNKEQDLKRLLESGLAAAVKEFLTEHFSLESAEHVLVEIRKAIYEADPEAEIILLIQDLARTKYAEDELIKACTADEQEGEPMAPMRTLFATTTGLFSGMQASTRQRVGLLGIAGHEWSKQRNPELQFASKYLEVFRAGRPDHIEADVPACLVCSGQDAREVFGEVEGVGLYPFTGELLRHLAVQTQEGDVFHPRSFLVALAGDLAGAAASIPQKAHPGPGFARLASKEEDLNTKEFVESLGLQREDEERASRALVGYGQGEGKSRRVPKLVFEAFDLPQSITSKDTERPRPPQEEKPPQPPDPPERRPKNPTDPLLDGIKNWTLAKEELLGDPDKALMDAAYKQFVEAIEWELHGVPLLVRKPTLAGRSIVFKNSKRSLERGMRELEVNIEVPAGSDSDARRVEFRKPWMRAYLMTRCESNQERFGWSKGSCPESFEEYGRLADAQDYLEIEVLQQVQNVLGSREEQLAWALRAVVREALDGHELLPSPLGRRSVLSWLEGMSSDSDYAKDVLRFVSSWKGSGKAFIADGYHLEHAIGVLKHIETEALRPEDPLEAQGGAVRKMLDKGSEVASLIQRERHKMSALFQKLSECMESHFGGEDAGARELLKLSEAIRDLASDLETSVGINVQKYKELSDSLAGLDHGSLERLRAVDDDSYNGLSAVLDQNLKNTAQDSLTQMDEVNRLLDDADDAISKKQGPSCDVTAARTGALGALDDLIEELSDLGGTRR